MRKTFRPYFSNIASDLGLAKENAQLHRELAEAQARIDRLLREKSDLVNRMNSEAFRLKAQTPCYTNCPALRNHKPPPA